MWHNDLRKSFFILDSLHLDKVRSQLYGYTFAGDRILDASDRGAGETPGPDGVYVRILREPGKITVTQDYLGSFGLYLFRRDDRFILSNSFLHLADYLKWEFPLSLNREFADYMLTAELCSASCRETLLREIELLDRSAVAEIDVSSRTLRIRLTDFQENTVDPVSPEGLAILDSWRNKWVRVLRRAAQEGNLSADLSGGFDSRLTFALLLSSGADLGRITVFSFEDQLHTHTDDYRIASLIADRFGFRLNDTRPLSAALHPFTTEETLELAFLAKLGVHKELYYQFGRYKKRRYSLTGSGGECLRNHWNMDPQAFTEKAVTRTRLFGKADPGVRIPFKHSVAAVLGRSFDDVARKMESFGRPLSGPELTQALYRETRCRSHFGKAMLERSLANLFTISPLLDRDLHRLRLTAAACPDENLLPALILDRYAPSLLDVPFEGGRSILPETVAFVRDLNRRQPFRDPLPPPGAAAELPAPGARHPAEPANDPDGFLLELFRSDRFRELFGQIYDPQVYQAVEQNVQRREYYPLAVVYVAVGIVEARLAARFSSVSGLAARPRPEKLVHDGRRRPRP